MNRGKIGRRRALIIAELTRGEANRHRSAPKYKPSHREWKLTFGPDGAPPAERSTVPVVFVVQEVEAVDQNAG